LTSTSPVLGSTRSWAMPRISRRTATPRPLISISVPFSHRRSLVNSLLAATVVIVCRSSYVWCGIALSLWPQSNTQCASTWSSVMLAEEFIGVLSLMSFFPQYLMTATTWQYECVIQNISMLLHAWVACMSFKQQDTMWFAKLTIGRSSKCLAETFVETHG
jgi:hypothetical protein